MNIEDFNGKSLVLLLFSEINEQEKEGAVFKGLFRVDETGCWLDRGLKGKVNIQEEWLSRIKSVPPEFAETLLNADYFLSLSVGPLPENSDESEFELTGLKWPKE